MVALSRMIMIMLNDYVFSTSPYIQKIKQDMSFKFFVLVSQSEQKLQNKVLNHHTIRLFTLHISVS